MVVEIFYMLLKNVPFHPILWKSYYVCQRFFQLKPSIPKRTKVSGIFVEEHIDVGYLDKIVYLKNEIYCLVNVEKFFMKFPKYGVITSIIRVVLFGYTTIFVVDQTAWMKICLFISQHDVLFRFLL